MAWENAPLVATRHVEKARAGRSTVTLRRLLVPALACRTHCNVQAVYFQLRRLINLDRAVLRHRADDFNSLLELSVAHGAKRNDLFPNKQ